MEVLGSGIRTRFGACFGGLDHRLKCDPWQRPLKSDWKRIAYEPLVLIPGLIKQLMSSCDKLTTRKVVRSSKERGGNGQVWWDLGSVNAPPPLYTETLALVGRLWPGCAVLTRKRIATTPGHFRMILKKKELSGKLQAASNA